MGIFQQFPYSNFHEMNLDQIIKIMREMQDEWEATKAVWASYKDFIDNYFANLDVSDEVLAVLRTMAADGTLNQIIDPTIVTETVAWLTEHITQPTTPVVDTSLSIAGAAADAKETGLLINDLKWYNSGSETLSAVNKAVYTTNGVTFSYVDTECWHASGAATADAIYNLFNSSAAFPGNIKAGDILDLFISSGNPNLKLQVFYYVNNEWQDGGSFAANAQTVVPPTATGMILRLKAAVNNVFDQSIFVRVSNKITNDMIGDAIPVIIPDSGIDCKYIIEAALAAYGCAYICEGTTLISGVRMPDNTRIMGAGSGAVLKTVNNQQNGIVVGANCTIDNITLDGGYGAIPAVESTTPAGISIIGNGTSAPYIYNTKISNCIIKGFSGSGIHMLNTGSWFANGASIVNCEIFYSWGGIWIDQNSEFNKVTNCIMRNCYAGVINNGGNNHFSNCDLCGNTTGIFFYRGFSGHNNGHGSMVNCLINHSGNNTGYAIIAREVNHGFIFDGCQIWYGKILMENCESFMFNNMIFGGNTPDIDYYNVGLLMIANCAFAAAPNIHGSASTVRKSECYLMDGTPV